ncbi:MAG TPA: MBL fold metallo-hydrolase [Polyangiaceae bacterium]|jgi:glyoxylase-like metal-dependent hydrolase (beta-lactamase superfamily II)|nr:MBL fold metallo-hydrolase [Polyangiaceae bacterium]
MRRVLKWLAGIVGLLALAAATVFYVAFGKNSSIVDGQQIAPGVTSVKDGFVGIFVLDAGPGKVALVDAGNDKEGKAILAALAKRSLTPASVGAIFLTHGHPDHIAGCSLFPGADVYAMKADLPLIGDSVKVTHPLNDGDVIEVAPELRVEAFATPGHTPGSAVYLAHGVLFFGDSAGASKEGTVMKAVSLFSKNSGQNVASLRALEARLLPRAAEIKALAFAHTGPLATFQPLVDFASRSN